jgi:dihydrofolate reductase
MTTITAAITTSLDGYTTGPNDGPEAGLGEGGERLHYWVFGGPWSYDEPARGEPTGVDKQYLDEMTRRAGAVIGGRGTYDAAGAWGGENPWPVPFFILTHRPLDEPEDGEFSFVDGLDEAVIRASEAAGDMDVMVMGGAHVIRQALAEGLVDELTITIAPVVLGAGKRLFEGFDQTLNLEHVRALQSPFATHITYRVLR